MNEIPQLLKDRTAVVFGVANRWSIAWAVAKRLAEAGAKVLMTYQDDRFADKVLAMAGEVPNCQARKCDLTKPEDVDSIYSGIEEDWGGLDTLVHSVAYALREDLDGRFRTPAPRDSGSRMRSAPTPWWPRHAEHAP